MRLIQALPLLLAVASAACISGSPTPSSSPAVSATASRVASTGATTTPSPTVAPTATPTRTAAVRATPVATLDAPPDGALGYSDFADVGWLGSYCWHGLCADVAEIPPKPELPEIRVPTRESVIFSLEDGEFVRWIAQYGAASASLVTFADGGQPFDPDKASNGPVPVMEGVEFEAPPAGDWIVRVQVFFEDGDASYYWHAIVE